MTVRIEKPAISLREELASARAKVEPQGRTLHFDNIVSNGSFSTQSTAGWSPILSNLDVSVDNGKLKLAKNATEWASGVYTIATVIGQAYRVRLKVDTTNMGSALTTVRIEENTSAPQRLITEQPVPAATAEAEYDLFFTATHSSSRLRIYLQTNDTANYVLLDDVSIVRMGANLIDNGNFTSGIEGWIDESETGGSVSYLDYTNPNGRSLALTSGATSANEGRARVEVPTVIGETYTFRFRVADGATNYGVGSGYLSSNIHGQGVTRQPGVHTATFVALSTTTHIFFRNFNNLNGTSLVRDVLLTRGPSSTSYELPGDFYVDEIYVNGVYQEEGLARDYVQYNRGTSVSLVPTIDLAGDASVTVVGVQK